MLIAALPTVKVRKERNRKKIWMTDEILKLMEDRRKKKIEKDMCV